MSDVALAAAAPVARKPFLRTATAIVWIVALAALLLVAWHVVDAGFVRRDIEALRGGEAWRTGGWLSQLVLSLVDLVPNLAWQQTALSFTAAVVAGLACGLLYDRMRAHGWTVVGSVVVLVLLAAHSNVLYTITAASNGLPLYFAFAAIIPAIGKLEQVGDVQSAIGLGLLMPLVLLAGPLTTPLIIPLALGAALADPDGRRDARAFVAMLLVAVIPALIVAIGVVGFVAQSGIGIENVILPYIDAYGAMRMGDVPGSIAALHTLAPVAIVPLLYCVWPNLPERRHIWSALAVIALPSYLAVARVVFNSTMQSFVPAVALLAAYVSWLCVVRLPLLLRVIAAAALALAVLTSWMAGGVWEDPEWQAALFSGLPLDAGAIGLRPGL